MRKRKDRSGISTNGQFLTVDGLARLLNVGRNTARTIGIQSGAMLKIGRCTRFDVETVMDYLRNVGA